MRALRDVRDEAARRGLSFCRGGIHLNLERVAGYNDRRTGGRSRENYVAGLEGDELRDVGHDGAEAKRECLGGVVLCQLAVDPRADADLVLVDGTGVDDVGTDRRESVAALGAQVRALVDVAQVVDAKIVCRGDGGHGGPAFVGGDATSACADNERNLTFEGEQFTPRGALHVRSRGG